MKIEFRPHVEVGSNGSKSYSEVFPFVNGQPANQIASCGYCTLNRDESEWCDGWVDDKENAPSVVLFARSSTRPVKLLI